MEVRLDNTKNNIVNIVAQHKAVHRYCKRRTTVLLGHEQGQDCHTYGQPPLVERHFREMKENDIM